MSDFNWTPKREAAATALAKGHTIAEAAAMIGVAERTIYRWKGDSEFTEMVDELSTRIGIASRAHRLRLVQRVARQAIRDGQIDTSKDLLDWLKFAQSETDGAKTRLEHSGNLNVTELSDDELRAIIEG